MIKRPKPGDDEDEILRMQEEFLRDKSIHSDFQPAAAVTNLRPDETSTKKRSNPDGQERKPSKYAQSKGLLNYSEKRVRIDPNISVMGDILEKNVESPTKTEVQIEDDQVYYPEILPSVVGSIVEKNDADFVEFDFKPMPSRGFPKVMKRNLCLVSKQKNNNSQQMDYENIKIVELPSSLANTLNDAANLKVKNLPPKSYILQSKEADNIHKDNINMLNNMSEEQIMEEQRKLLSSLDPKLIEFLKTKSKSTHSDMLIAKEQTLSKVYHINKKNMPEAMDTSEVEQVDNNIWENDVLSHPNVHKWLHFDSLEKDKLEWIKGVEECKKINPEKPYEARFDFKGYLLPYIVEYTEKTKTLFHHGEEPHRPGYTLTELFELSRSTVTQQRAMALNTIAGVLEYYMAGTYKDILELPLSKIFFVIRIAMDENKVIILEPALKAMRNLLYNRIDEASLDALLGFEEGSQQPCLENDKSEIKEIESHESELKDFHLAEVDLIAAALRTEMLQRIYYIFENIKPSFNCVQYALQILIRLVRDSVETATKVVEMEHLMQTILKYFVPVTSINFRFEPHIVYNDKPILAALKFLRVLSLQSREVGEMIISKYGILKPISEYILSTVDGTYGLRLQIEAYSIHSNILSYDLAIDNAVSLSPVIVTAIYRHVQGTDVFFNCSVMSITHASVVLQFANQLLQRNVNINSLKHQIYPLLKDGIQKWLIQLSDLESYSCGHLRVICAALDCCKTVLLKEGIQIKVLNDSLKSTATSPGFINITKHLMPSSNLLSGLNNKDLFLTRNLKSLATSLIDKPQKVLPTLNVLSPVPLLASLFKILECIEDKDVIKTYIVHLSSYLQNLADTVPSLCDNWFTRIETNIVFSILKLSTYIFEYLSEQSKDLFYNVANKLCYTLRVDKQYELHFLFNEIIFNRAWFTAERLVNLLHVSDSEGFSKAFNSEEEIKKVYSKVINLNFSSTGPNIVLRNWQEPILPRDWIYLPILNLYSKSQEIKPIVVGEHAKKVESLIAIEKEYTVRCSLEWIMFNEMCFPNLLEDIDITDRLCRVMCIFMCDNSLFLETTIKVLLQRSIQLLFRQEKRNPFNFDRELTGLNNFQDFYTQLLEQFQSVSYGDPIFAACILAPLAQKHNSKWRKLLWSEYAGCLRALDCPENLLCYDIKEYLYPVESDKSLVKSYFQALSSNLLRPNTVMYKIAEHHVKHFKNRPSSE